MPKQFPKRRHDYDGDGQKDARGADRCKQCGTPKPNAMHQPAPVSVRDRATAAIAAAAERDRRILGDR